jgi:hypothetical protein
MSWSKVLNPTKIKNFSRSYLPCSVVAFSLCYKAKSENVNKRCTSSTLWGGLGGIFRRATGRDDTASRATGRDDTASRATGRDDTASRATGRDDTASRATGRDDTASRATGRSALK